MSAARLATGAFSEARVQLDLAQEEMLCTDAPPGRELLFKLELSYAAVHEGLRVSSLAERHLRRAAVLWPEGEVPGWVEKSHRTLVEGLQADVLAVDEVRIQAHTPEGSPSQGVAIDGLALPGASGLRPGPHLLSVKLREGLWESRWIDLPHWPAIWLVMDDRGVPSLTPEHVYLADPLGRLLELTPGLPAADSLCGVQTAACRAAAGLLGAAGVSGVVYLRTLNTLAGVVSPEDGACRTAECGALADRAWTLAGSTVTLAGAAALSFGLAMSQTHLRPPGESPARSRAVQLHQGAAGSLAGLSVRGSF